MDGLTQDMFRIQIETSLESYAVKMGASLLQSLDQFDFLIFDGNVPSVRDSLAIGNISVLAAESNKNLDTAELILTKMKRVGLNRKSKVLVVGGGVVQDLATLACSLYMRGVSWSYEPTTLTSMIDSCVGGKSSINVGDSKNLIGNVYPPQTVNIELDHLRSLPTRALIDGVSEGVKICFARSDKDFQKFVSSIPDPRNLDATALGDAIETSLTSKKWFVEKDEFDNQERRLLNFGHTFGHALESASGFKFSHGASVALGMLAAIHFSRTSHIPRVALLSEFCLKLLSPISQEIRGNARAVDWSTFDSSVRSDKKNTFGFLHLILPNDSGFLEEIKIPVDDNALESISASLKHAIGQVRS